MGWGWAELQTLPATQTRGIYRSMEMSPRRPRLGGEAGPEPVREFATAGGAAGIRAEPQRTQAGHMQGSGQGGTARLAQLEEEVLGGGRAWPRTAIWRKQV